MIRSAAIAPLALTIGEPSGIGLDIAIAAWLRRRPDDPPFILIGDKRLLAVRAERLGSDVPLIDCRPEDAAGVFDKSLPCLEGGPVCDGEPGITTPDGARAAIASIREAIDLMRTNRVSAVVTNPVNKKALNAVGFAYPGHTEFLGALAAELFDGPHVPVMMLAGPDLRVVPVTIHIPLAAVPAALTTDLIVQTGRIVHADLRRRFGIAEPRLALAGLNPHAGEEGMLGSEEDTVVRPAVEALRADGIDATGPFPADTMFHAPARASYDVALCMYHDQALIPIKTLAFDDGVNVTLGLPFIRTSPDHGTALPLGATGRARPDSLIAALRLAGDLARTAAAA